MWDYEISMAWLTHNVMEDDKENPIIKNLSNAKAVMNALERVLNEEDIREINENTELSKLTDLIYRKIDKKDERDAVLSLIKIGSEADNE